MLYQSKPHTPEYLTDREKRGKIEQIIKREEGIAMALDTLVTITQDEKEYAYMSSLIKGERVFCLFHLME
jgi:hypothetical protein